MTFLEMTFSGAVMILAAAALRALTLRRLPKETFVALWWLTAIRLLVPLELPSRFSVYTLSEFLRREAAPTVSAAPTAPAATPYVPARVTVIPGPSEAVPAPVSAPLPIWRVVWLTGAVLLALWFLVHYIRWRRRFRQSTPAECPDTYAHSWRKVRIRVTDRIGAPLTYGILRPVILLPKTLDLADKEAVSCVLAHEMSHIRRLDGLFKLVLAAALCLHWFNPAVWLLYVLANRDMELRCDEAAVLALGEDSRARYALALIRLAELQNNYVPLCGFSHKSGMEERIQAIMNVKKKSLLACFLALALVLGITTAFATSAKPAPADEDLTDENLTDTQILAEVSKEVAVQWDEVLAPYVPFGLTYEFDDPDHDGNGLTMWYEGREVRGIFDGKSGAWITERAGNGSYGPDAAEMYAMYDDNGLIGLRFASEEEQEEWTAARESEENTWKALAGHIQYDNGRFYFSVPEAIPEGEDHWRIFIRGRIMTEDGMGMSVHYLEEESERGEWIPGETYSFAVADAAYDELLMDVEYGSFSHSFDLTRFLPERKPMAQEPLPEGKADIPEGADMIWPVDSDRITNGFGNRAKPGGADAVNHNGVDIGGMEAGSPIYAAKAGTVKDTGFNADNGNYVRLDHGDGMETFYAHCQSVLVKTGDSVILGQTIATVGSTGKSTGPHLHFEIVVNGFQRDPENYYHIFSDPTYRPWEQLGISEEEYWKREDEQRKEMEEKYLVNGAYPRNSRGETYGPSYFNRDLGEPDLIAAMNDNRTEGYISKAENLLPHISNPEEANAYMNWREENKISGHWIPLYDKEHNVIGNFLVGDSSGKVLTLEQFLEAQANGWHTFS